MLQIKKSLILLLFIGLISCAGDSNDFNPDLGGTGTAGSMAKFTIVGQNLLVLQPGSIIHYVIGDGGDLVYSRELVFFSGDLETIFPYGDKVLVGSTNQIYFLGFDSQNTLDLISSYRHITACDPVVASNGIAFSTLRSNNCRVNTDEVLEIIDISDLGEPRLIKSYQTQAPYGLTINEQNLFVCERGGVAMYDVSDPENILPKGFAEFSNERPLDIIHTQEYLIVRTDKHIYNMSYTSSGLMNILARVQ